MPSGAIPKGHPDNPFDPTLPSTLDNPTRDMLSQVPHSRDPPARICIQPNHVRQTHKASRIVFVRQNQVDRPSVFSLQVEARAVLAWFDEYRSKAAEYPAMSYVGQSLGSWRDGFGPF